MLGIFQVSQGIGYYGFGTLVPIVLLARGYSVVASLGFTAACYAGYPLGSLASLLLIDRVERKHLIAWSGALMAGLGIGFSAAGRPLLTVACGFLYTLCSGVFSNAYHIYQSEFFPTRIRAVTVGLCYSLSRLSVAVMPLALIPVLRLWGPEVLFAMIGALMAVASASVAFLGPRTTRRPLETIPYAN